MVWLQQRRRRRKAGAVPGPPVTPGNLQGTDMFTFIRLNWQDLSADETEFRIHKKVDAGNFTLYQQVAANTVQFDDSTVSFGSTYTYYVTAFNANGESAPSNTTVIPFGS